MWRTCFANDCSCEIRYVTASTSAPNSDLEWPCTVTQLKAARRHYTAGTEQNGNILGDVSRYPERGLKRTQVQVIDVTA